ncbi:MAG: serine O-acetyltransferase [Alphaproteobacteria bacterium]
MFKFLKDEIDSIISRDPAAQSRLEVLLCYQGFHAIIFYRISNFLWHHKLKLCAKIVATIARWLTGIEIHPAARLGKRIFIDHGFGLVIGETAEVGDDVTLYHDVTLGGTSTIKSDGSLDKGKRHPTLKSGVIIGAGAQILGPITVGKDARVGSNAVVLKDVPENVTVVGIPAKISGSGDHKFAAYATPIDCNMPDPITKTLEKMQKEIEELKKQIASK